MVKHFLNGSSISDKQFAGTSPFDGTITIGNSGKNGYDSPAMADIYCIRVYGRALSEDEIIQNYLIDRKRFEIS